MNITGDVKSGVTVTGLEELKRNLMKIAEDASGPDMEAAIMRTAVEMAGDMRDRAHPFLRPAIVAKPFSNTMDRAVSAMVAIDRNYKDANGTEVGYYAHLFEFGTGPRYRRSTRQKGGGLGNLMKVIAGTAGGYTGRIAARPFFRPVVDAWRGEKFLSRMARAFESILEKREFGDTWGGGML
jgi:hypothetical protein